MTRPLGITDSQLEMIMHACEPLLPVDRDPFLRALAHRLSSEPEIGDGTIARACRELQRTFWRPPTLEAPRHTPRHDRGRVGEPIA